jgi:hypothetical protein
MRFDNRQSTALPRLGSLTLPAHYLYPEMQERLDYPNFR